MKTSILLLFLGFALGLATDAALEHHRLVSIIQPVQAVGTCQQSPTGTVAGDLSQALDPADQQLDEKEIALNLGRIQGIWRASKRQLALDEFGSRLPMEQIPQALKTASLLRDDKERRRFDMALLIRLGKVNPLSAMACINDIDGKIVDDGGYLATKEFFRLAALEQWASGDLEGAIFWVRVLPSGGSRSQVLAKIIPALAAKDPKRAFALLSELEPAPANESYDLLFRQWALVDPIQALQKLNQRGEGSFAEKRELLDNVFSVWSARDPEIAMRYAKELPAGELRNRASVNCVTQLAERDASAAINMAKDFPDGTWRNGLIADLFSRWAVNDVESAYAACEQLPEGSLRGNSLRQVMQAKMAADPASVSEYVYNLPPGENRQDAIGRLCEAWGDQDSSAALAWAQSLPSGPERIAAIGSVISSWAYSDPKGAVQFARANHELPDLVLEQIASKWAGKDFAAAQKWSESMEAGKAKDSVRLVPNRFYRVRSF